MNPVVGFSPDPMSRSQSAGEYSFADGTTLYGDDPELYSQIGGMSGGDGGGGNMSYMPPEQPAPAPAPMPPPGTPFAPEDQVQAGLQAYGEGMPEAKAYDAEQKARAEQQQREQFQLTHKYVPGRAGVTGEQLEQQAASGVEIPVATTTQVSPGLQDTPEDAEARADQGINERLTAQKRADFEGAKLTNQIAHLDQDTQRAQQEVGYRKILQESAAIQADKQMSVLDQTAKAYKEHKIDANRIISSKGMLGEIASVIAQAGGAYAAILSGTGRNYAQEIIDNAIERDVAVQKLEHDQLGEAADNAYSRFLQMTGDAKQAEDLLRATQNRLVGVERERFAAESGRDEVAVALGEWETQHAAKRLAEETAIRERAIGKIVQSTQSQMQYPRAGSGGGYRPKTEQEIRAEILAGSEFDTKLAENTAKRAEAGEKVAELSGASGKVKANPLYVEGYGEARTQAEASEIRNVMAQKSTTDAYLNTIEEFIAKDPGSRTPEDYQNYNNAVNRIEDAEAKAISGGVGSIQQGERDAAKERGFEQKEYSVHGKAADSLSRAFDFGLTGSSRESQIAKVQAIRADHARRARNRINEVVGGKHPEVPEPGVSK